MGEPDILVSGNVNVDLVLGEVDGWPAIGTEIEVERSETRAGGSAGNTALALAGMGVPHRLIASVGDDSYGDWLREAFAARSSDWIVEPGATTVTVGIVHRGGDRAFFTTPGHLRHSRAQDVIDRIPVAPHARAVALISGGFLIPDMARNTVALLDAFHAGGWRTAIDPGWPPSGWTPATRALMAEWLAAADIALLNEDEVRGLTGAEGAAGASALRNLAREELLLVVKRGAEGATAWGPGDPVTVAAPAVEVVDTVGAGDTFNAGFLASWTRGEILADALAAGVHVAARAISTYPRRYV